MTATARVLRRALTAALAVATGLAVFLLGPASASAASSVPIDIGAGFTTNPSGPLITITKLIPGGSSSAVVGVRNLSNASADIALQLTNVHDDEHGCTKSEALVDTTCDDPGPGEGDLGADLVFTIDEGTAKTGPFTNTWTGSAATLVSAATDISAAIPATSDRWLRITVSLPFATGNETQTDTFGFGIQVDLTGLGTVVVPAAATSTATSTAPSTGTATTPTTPTSGSNAGSGASSSHGVGGVSASNSGGSNGAGGQSAGGTGLASTGVNVVLMTLIGALLILCGFLLLQRRRGAREN
ncbi:MAG TPA: hypothetical protein VFT67_04130 [Jatrophihabitantaceae bacterium]|nr:hypothetical protein [Jatrophihabitantaceae bacterium]